MKKIFFLLIAANGVLSAFAQKTEQPAKSMRPAFTGDSLLSRWIIDVNLKGGMLTQDMTTNNTLGNYTNAINNASLGTLKFTNGMSYGAEAQIGYFFDNKSHFGVGTGLSYMYQTGDATLDKFHVEYQSADANGNTFRQLLTANQAIKESLKITNINVPLVLKYKNRFSKNWGIAADAGLLFNLQMKNSYSTNASFDYEAIYKLNTAANGSQVAVYDNLLYPSENDLVITQAQYLKTHPGGNAQDYLNYERSLGHNAGAGVKPTNGKGDVSYSTGSVGFLVQPSVNYFFSDKVALNLGLYYCYQTFKQPTNDKRLTDKLGDYSSVINTVSATNNQSYGLNLGVRFFFAKLKDSDHDGVPDRTDKCPFVYGVSKFRGCPDTDGDGVPDAEDVCPDVPGLMIFHGCPDSDGDGIPDKDDACPYAAGPSKTHGCPDTDGDGIPDNDDKCPLVAGPAVNMGCPIDTPKPAPPPPPAPAPKYKGEKPEHDMTEPVLFDLGKSTIKEASLGILMDAVMEMNSNENAFVIIDGHTDNTGSAPKNDILSFKRANAVKRYLTEMGGDPKRMIGIGHGSREPIAPNTTAEGRAKNRRVIMSLKHHSKKD